MPRDAYRAVRLLVTAGALASLWAGHHRPELAFYLGSVALGGYLVFAVIAIGRLARAPERPPGLVRRTSVSLGLSGALMATVLLVRWVHPVVTLLILVALFTVEVRGRPPVTS